MIFPLKALLIGDFPLPCLIPKGYLRWIIQFLGGPVVNHTVVPNMTAKRKTWPPKKRIWALVKTSEPSGELCFVSLICCGNQLRMYYPIPLIFNTWFGNSMKLPTKNNGSNGIKHVTVLQGVSKMTHLTRPRCAIHYDVYAAKHCFFSHRCSDVMFTNF